MHIYELGYVRGVRRMTRASHPALICNKQSREDKKGEDRRDAARDRTSEEPVRKKIRNEVRAAKKKQRNDGASTGAGSSTEIKDAAAMACYACGDKGHALRECTKVEEGAKKSIMEEKFQE
jgi:Zinc knuckle